MKTKVIIFGAGGAGENFLSVNTKYEVIAISDNNEELWGTEIKNISVISPSEIPRLEFDLVIITSSWVDSIQKQLLNELNIPKNKLLIPTKSVIKSSILPFEHLPTLEIAKDLMVAISNFYKKHQINVFADFGTLLGLIREGDIISWDDDIDFSINEEDFETAVELIQNNRPELPIVDNVNWKISLVSHANKNVAIQIEPEYNSDNGYRLFQMGLSKRSVVNGNSEVVSLSGMLYAPESFFKGCDIISAFGHNFITPKDPEKYLEFVYGEWRTPRKGMTLKDYNNRNQILKINTNSIKVSKKEIV